MVSALQEPDDSDKKTTSERDTNDDYMERIELPIHQQWPPRSNLPRSTSQFSLHQTEYTPPGTGRRPSLIPNHLAHRQRTPRPSVVVMPPLDETSPRHSVNVNLPVIRVSDFEDLRHPRRHSVASGSTRENYL